MTYVSLYDREDIARSYLSDKRAVHTYANTCWADGEKKAFQPACIHENGEELLPAEIFEKLFRVSVSQKTGGIFIGNELVFPAGHAILIMDETEHAVPAGTVKINGILYLPALSYGKYFLGDDSFYDDGHGMLLAGKRLFRDDPGNKAANLFLFFERADAKTLKERFIRARKGNLKEHPRIMLTAERVGQLREETKTDPYKRKWLAGLIGRGEELLKRGSSTYSPAGGRLLDVANAALSRTEILAFLYQMTGDMKYALSVKNELEALLSFPDWDQRHFLDFTTIALTFAIGYDWIYDTLTDAERDAFALAARSNTLIHYQKIYEGTSPVNDFFRHTETNWGIITHGGLAVFLLATAEYETDESMRLLSDALRAMEFTWYRFAPDGAWYEGPGYWTYMLTHLCRFEGAFETAMGSFFAKDYKGLDRYGYFQCFFMGPDAMPNNFHDADAYNIQNEGQFVLARMYGDAELMRYRRGQMEKWKLKPAPLDLIYYDTRLTGDESPVSLSKDCFFRETEFVGMRESWEDPEGSWLSYHGGEVHNAHDHYDVGSFVYYVGGVRWAVDPGKDPVSYELKNPAAEAGYSTREYYRIRAEGHNVLVIDPDITPGMRDGSFSPLSPITYRDGSVSGQAELTDAYSDYVTAYTRTFVLSEHRRVLTVRDILTLKKPFTLRWFMHTNADIRVESDRAAYLMQDGRTLKAEFETNAPQAHLTWMEAVSLPGSPHFRMADNTGLRKLDYQIEADGKLTITVRMILI